MIPVADDTARATPRPHRSRTESRLIGGSMTRSTRSCGCDCLLTGWWREASWAYPMQQVVVVVPSDNRSYRERITSPDLAAAVPSARTVAQVVRVAMVRPGRGFRLRLPRCPCGCRQRALRAVSCRLERVSPRPLWLVKFRRTRAIEVRRVLRKRFGHLGERTQNAAVRGRHRIIWYGSDKPWPIWATSPEAATKWRRVCAQIALFITNRGMQNRR